MNRKIFILVAVYLLVLLVNDGFMALDEYWVGITRYIPAQSSSLMTLVAADDVKSPLQLLPMHAVAQLAYQVGIVSPYWQYRSVIFILGIVSFILILVAFRLFTRINNLSDEKKNYLYLMLAFYFAAPFALTRPMFESVAAPWVTLAGVMALRYDLEEKLFDLLWGVFFISVAFVLRQQLGFCALIFVMLPIFKRNYKHMFYAGSLGLVFVILSGIPDYFIRGQFHYSLLNLTVYNFKHGSDYGDRTIAFYPILIFIVTLFPFFIKKYPAGFVADQIKRSRSLIIMLMLFVFLHSLFPQKWERFIISMIPLLIFIFFPFLHHLHTHFKENKLRLYSLYLLNGFLFFISSFFPAQKNLIEMSRYLDRHAEIKTVYRLASTPEWITEAFVLNKNFNFIDADKLNLKEINWQDCSQVIVIGEPYAAEYKYLTDKLILNAHFGVNLIEKLSYIGNPKNNLRRVGLYFYSGCER